jgi:hypothetical protein
MDQTKKTLADQFKVSKPVKIEYASHEEVSAATDKVLKEHWLAFELLSKS